MQETQYIVQQERRTLVILALNFQQYFPVTGFVLIGTLFIDSCPGRVESVPATRKRFLAETILNNRGTQSA
jgi:hypothetical protein